MHIEKEKEFSEKEEKENIKEVVMEIFRREEENGGREKQIF